MEYYMQIPMHKLYFVSRWDKLFRLGEYYCVSRILHFHVVNYKEVYLYDITTLIHIIKYHKHINLRDIHEGTNLLYNKVSLLELNENETAVRLHINKTQFYIDTNIRIKNEIQ